MAFPKYNSLNENQSIGPSRHGGAAEWLRRHVSNHARSTRVGSNPVVGTISHKLTVNSAVHPSEVGK